MRGLQGIDDCLFGTLARLSARPILLSSLNSGECFLPQATEFKIVAQRYHSVVLARQVGGKMGGEPPSRKGCSTIQFSLAPTKLPLFHSASSGLM